jgi:hypothetical protein
LSVGDQVVVSRRLDERTRFCEYSSSCCITWLTTDLPVWPGISTNWPTVTLAETSVSPTVLHLPGSFALKLPRAHSTRSWKVYPLPTGGGAMNMYLFAKTTRSFLYLMIKSRSQR